MLNRLFILFILSISINIFSQNLIPNHSFENYKYDKNDYYTSNELSQTLNDWYSPNDCTPDLIVMKPKIEIGKKTYRFKSYKCLLDSISSDGNACIGLILQNCFGACLNSRYKYADREYIQVQLTKPLKKNRYYLVSFDFKLPNNSLYAIDGLGVKFTKYPIILKQPVGFSGGAQITNPSRNILSNNYWIKFRHIYKADNRYKYITIGNFSSKVNYRTNYISKTDSICQTSGAYYLIDNIVVREITDTNLIIEDLDHIKKPEIKKKPSIHQNFENKPNDEYDNKIILKFEIQDILFDFRDSTLNKHEIILLDSIIQRINSISFKQIDVIGHTDKIGSKEFNYDLSLKRAKAVAEYLTKNGINDNLIKCYGKGETEPIDDFNDKKNRRVEILIKN